MGTKPPIRPPALTQTPVPGLTRLAPLYIGPLAVRFRMQRRTGVLFGLAAIAGGIVAIERFADNGRSPLEPGDPEANIMIGALGAMTISVLQLEAAGRTLRRLAAGFQSDGSYGTR